MEIKNVREQITKKELEDITREGYGDLVKAVIDLTQGIMAVGGEMHADEEQILLAQGSKQQDLWGINLYPENSGEGFIEFDSMINLRPSQGNRSRSVEDAATREKIKTLVARMII